MPFIAKEYGEIQNRVDENIAMGLVPKIVFDCVSNDIVFKTGERKITFTQLEELFRRVEELEKLIAQPPPYKDK